MYHQRFKSLKQKFSEKYKVEESGCWVWISGAHRPQEHPKIWVDGGYRIASHVSWELAEKGEKRPGDQVLHTCDNPRCVNPDHLFLGDHLSNMQDKARKGRCYRPIGEKNPKAKITRKDAEEIRALYASGGISQQAIADRYSLRQATVSLIVLGKAWK